jgi:hypothetical protein
LPCLGHITDISPCCLTSRARIQRLRLFGVGGCLRRTPGKQGDSQGRLDNIGRSGLTAEKRPSDSKKPSFVLVGSATMATTPSVGRTRRSGSGRLTAWRVPRLDLVCWHVSLLIGLGHRRRTYVYIYSRCIRPSEVCHHFHSEQSTHEPPYNQLFVRDTGANLLRASSLSCVRSYWDSCGKMNQFRDISY